MSFKNNHFIRVPKQFTFDMAHALYGYDGPCKNIHGHTYKLSITLKGKVIENPNDPKDGMVIDFTDFKRIVANNIISIFDHSLVLNSKAPYGDLKILNENFERINFVPYQPSCENLLVDFLNKMSDKLPEGVNVNSIKLEETPTSFAEWFAEDN